MGWTVSEEGTCGYVRNWKGVLGLLTVELDNKRS